MENKEKWFSTIQELRNDCAIKQKHGLHFILTSVIIWLVVFGVHLTSMPTMTKNFVLFCCSAFLFPIAYLMSKLLKVDFQNKANPLTNLGIIFAANQMLYILIAMWVYSSMPDKFLMVYAIIFGAHLLPYGWLYQSKAYVTFSILIPVVTLIVGLYFSAVAVAGVMVLFEIALCSWLALETKKRAKNS